MTPKARTKGSDYFSHGRRLYIHPQPQWTTTRPFPTLLTVTKRRNAIHKQGKGRPLEGLRPEESESICRRKVSPFNGPPAAGKHKRVTWRSWLAWFLDEQRVLSTGEKVSDIVESYVCALHVLRVDQSNKCSAHARGVLYRGVMISTMHTRTR